MTGAFTFNILGLLGLTLAGVIGIAAIHSTIIKLGVPVILPGDGRIYVGSWDNGYVSGIGTWVIEQDRHMSPMNVSSVSCVRQDGICYDAQASITWGFLNSYLDRYPIERWDSSTIQFKNDAPSCVTYTYVIDRATQKLSGRRLKKSDVAQQDCTSIQSNDLRLSFVSGSEVEETLRRESAPTVASLVIGTGFVFLMLAWMWKVIRR